MVWSDKTNLYPASKVSTRAFDCSTRDTFPRWLGKSEAEMIYNPRLDKTPPFSLRKSSIWLEEGPANCVTSFMGVNHISPEDAYTARAGVFFPGLWIRTRNKI